MLQSTRSAFGDAYYQGGSAALYTAPQYTNVSKPVAAPLGSTIKTWAPWFIGGLLIGGGAYLLLGK